MAIECLDDLKDMKVSIRAKGTGNIVDGDYKLVDVTRDRIMVKTLQGKPAGYQVLVGFHGSVVSIALKDGTVVYENPTVEDAYDGSPLSPQEKDELVAQGEWKI